MGSIIGPLVSIIFLLLLIIYSKKTFVKIIAFCPILIIFITTAIIKNNDFLSELLTEYAIIDTVKLVSMKDTSQIEGKFFLGSGSINNNIFYSFYYREKDKGIKYGQVFANNTTIYDDSQSDDVILKKYKQVFKEKWLSWILPLNNREKYEIYSPPNKIIITDEYNLDLQ